MLNRRIILRDLADGTTYRMEYSEDTGWRFYRNDQSVELTGHVRFSRDGGTIKATTSSGEKLFIPQQRFTGQPPTAPTLNDHALELVEWGLGDTRWLNGKEV
jgi:hypothetical protein